MSPTALRLALTVTVVLPIALPGAAVATDRQPTPKPAREVVGETGGTPLESIADEAAIAGDAGDLPGDRDPMQNVEDEMIADETDDGCTGSVGADCPGGDN